MINVLKLLKSPLSQGELGIVYSSNLNASCWNVFKFKKMLTCEIEFIDREITKN